MPLHNSLGPSSMAKLYLWPSAGRAPQVMGRLAAVAVAQLATHCSSAQGVARTSRGRERESARVGPECVAPELLGRGLKLYARFHNYMTITHLRMCTRLSVRPSVRPSNWPLARSPACLLAVATAASESCARPGEWPTLGAQVHGRAECSLVQGLARRVPRARVRCHARSSPRPRFERTKKGPALFAGKVRSVQRICRANSMGARAEPLDWPH